MNPSLPPNLLQIRAAKLYDPSCGELRAAFQGSIGGQRWRKGVRLAREQGFHCGFIVWSRGAEESGPRQTRVFERCLNGESPITDPAPWDPALGRRGSPACWGGHVPVPSW